MKTQFYELEPDLFAEHVPEPACELDATLNLTAGKPITGRFPTPLVFTTGHSADDPPKGLHNRCDPVMSNELVEALHAAGVSNMQCFPAELRSEVDGSVWRNYQAVNVVGLISAADMKASRGAAVISAPSATAVPLAVFETLRVDPVRAGEALIFRLAEAPSRLIVAARVIDHLLQQHSAEEWGISIDPVA